MSLNWSVEKIENWQEVCQVEVLDHRGNTVSQWSPVTMSLAWLLMHTGLGEITEANAEEFYCRVKFWEKINEPMVTNGDGTPRPCTPEDIRDHIGMYANVGPESRAKFLKRQTDYFFGEATIVYRRQIGERSRV